MGGSVVNRTATFAGIVGAALCLYLPAAPAQAQATRTWVSGVGDDANPCSRTAPCKTFAGAISKTAVGGEIDALDPGGYGAVTITKAITIDGGGGQVASVLVSGTNGIVVAAGANDVVILRNLRVNGIGIGINGIRFLSGLSLTVENCDIFGFTTNGIDLANAANAGVLIINTTINNVGGSAIGVNSAVPTFVSADNVHTHRTNFGISVANGNKAIVTRSVFSFASTAALQTGTGGQLSVDAVQAVNSVTGIQSAGVVAFGNSDIMFNGTAISGTTGSYGNNRIQFNTSAGTAPMVSTATTDHGQQ
jgi:hypothetical protein